MSESRKDPLVEVRKRVDEYLNIDVPLMVSRGQLAEPQLFELVGILGLWMRAVVGMVDDEISRAIDSFIQAIIETYAYDARPLPEKLYIHIASAFKDNPALLKLRQMITEAMSATPDDPASQASARFMQYATAPAVSPEVIAYFQVLAGGP